MKFSTIKETEDNYSPKVKEYLKYIEMIHRDCKPFLAKEKNLLSRGLGSENDLFIEKQIRTDRRPKDTDPKMSKFFDEVFYELFRVKLRSEALFAIRQSGHSTEYGNAYIIFPQGKYDIFVSTSISDLYTDIAGKGLFPYLMADVTKQEFMKLGDNQEESDTIGNLYDMFDHYNTQDVLRNLHSVHVEFKSAADKMIGFIEQFVKEIIKDSYQYDDGSNMRNELMIAIHDSERKYYGINVSQLRRKVPAGDVEVFTGSPANLLAYLEVNLRHGILKYL